MGMIFLACLKYILVIWWQKKKNWFALETVYHTEWAYLRKVLNLVQGNYQVLLTMVFFNFLSLWKIAHYGECIEGEIVYKNICCQICLLKYNFPEKSLILECWEEHIGWTFYMLKFLSSMSLQIRVFKNSAWV